MMEYKRLTKSNYDINKIEYPSMVEYKRMFQTLAELEDKIEQGTLIEQKTCENVSEMHPVDGFTCSECGITLVDFVRQITDEDYETTYHEYEIKYCPNCGAKVVE